MKEYLEIINFVENFLLTTEIESIDSYTVVYTAKEYCLTLMEYEIFDGIIKAATYNYNLDTDT